MEAYHLQLNRYIVVSHHQDYMHSVLEFYLLTHAYSTVDLNLL